MKKLESNEKEQTADEFCNSPVCFAYLKKLLNKFINRETVSYVICGALTTLVSLGSYWIFEQMGWSVLMCQTVSTFLAIAFAYFVNKIFVFSSTRWSINVLAKEIFAFVAGRFTVFAAETVLLVALVDGLGLPGFPCKLFTNALVLVSNYIISKRAVFNK